MLLEGPIFVFKKIKRLNNIDEYVKKFLMISRRDYDDFMRKDKLVKVGEIEIRISSLKSIVHSSGVTAFARNDVLYFWKRTNKLPVLDIIDCVSKPVCDYVFKKFNFDKTERSISMVNRIVKTSYVLSKLISDHMEIDGDIDVQKLLSKKRK